MDAMSEFAAEVDEYLRQLDILVGEPSFDLGGRKEKPPETAGKFDKLDHVADRVLKELDAADKLYQADENRHSIWVRRYVALIIFAILVAAIFAATGRLSGAGAVTGGGTAGALALFGRSWLQYEKTRLTATDAVRRRAETRAMIRAFRLVGRSTDDAKVLRSIAKSLRELLPAPSSNK